ncbi:MAG TPA: mannosyltransferase family protein [Ktedonobacteraceae bacterium]|nr:mannosyltransferase family protein [Ktedonobacteraceae bacterium]
MLRDKLPWQEPIWPFFLSRGIILATTWFSLAIFPPSGTKNGLNCAQQLKACLLTWNYWDQLSYSDIAHYGYHLAQSSVFFPLWPFCLRLLGNMFGGMDEAYFFSALLLANLLFYLALVLFFALSRKIFSASLARKTLFCLALYPYTVFFFAGYTESLFLLLSLATFYCLQFRHLAAWWLAGLCAGLAALTRVTGLMLLVPFCVVFVQRYCRGKQCQQTSWGQKLLALAPLLLIPLGVACYMYYLGIVWKNPLLFVAAERTGWGRHTTFPWLGLVETVTALLTGYQLLHNLLDLLFTLLPLLVLAIGWRRLPISYSLYALAMLLFALSNPSISTEPLTSAPRYLLTIFPCFLLLGLWCKYPLFERLYITLASIFLVLFTIFFVHHYWLA